MPRYLQSVDKVINWRLLSEEYWSVPVVLSPRSFILLLYFLFISPILSPVLLHWDHFIVFPSHYHYHLLYHCRRHQQKPRAQFLSFPLCRHLWTWKFLMITMIMMMKIMKLIKIMKNAILLLKAFVNLIESFGWKSFTILYEDNQVDLSWWGWWWPWG